MGVSTRNAGAGATSVAAKMSVVLPAAYSIVFLKEPVLLWQLLGMALSLFCVYLMKPDGGQTQENKNAFWVLVLVFIGSGMVDTGLNIVKNHYGQVVNDYKLSTVVFGSAGVIGFIILLFFYKGKKPGIREIVGGMVLGSTNYLSLLAMFGGIGFYKGSTAWFFAVNNIGVVALSTLVSVLFFQEKINRMGYVGLALSAIAIVLMNLNAIL
jgi:drug/metabolite transporter (DMT)-like permease